MTALRPVEKAERSLSHYTEKPFVFDPTRAYKQERVTFKPHGLWLSVDGDDGWPEWCRSENYAVEALAHRTEFRIVEGANILRLSTPEAVLSLGDRYPTGPEGYLRGWVDWEPIIAQYDGVLADPYMWSLRFELKAIWYSTWDCASGCFWNLNAVTVVDPAASEVSDD